MNKDDLLIKLAHAVHDRNIVESSNLIDDMRYENIDLFDERDKQMLSMINNLIYDVKGLLDDMESNAHRANKQLRRFNYDDE